MVCRWGVGALVRKHSWAVHVALQLLSRDAQPHLTSTRRGRRLVVFMSPWSAMSLYRPLRHFAVRSPRTPALYPTCICRHFKPDLILRRPPRASRDQRPEKLQPVVHQRLQKVPPKDVSPGSQRHDLPRSQAGDGEPAPHSRVLPSVLWSAKAVVVIYLALAAGSALSESIDASKQRSTRRASDPPLWTPNWTFNVQAGTTVTNLWQSMDDTTKFAVGLAGANCAVHAGSTVMPKMWRNMWSIPALTPKYTLLTSAFVHWGAIHLLASLYAIYVIMDRVGHSPLFQNSSSHLAAFYLSAAVLSACGHHVATRAWRAGVWSPCGGASGALYACFAASAVMHPDDRYGILFLPFSMPAEQLIYALCSVETAIFAFRLRTGIGHAVSLVCRPRNHKSIDLPGPCVWSPRWSWIRQTQRQ